MTKHERRITKDEGMTANDEAQMTNDEGMATNDEARMSDAKGMTKSEGTRQDLEETFWNSPTELTVREEPRAARVYDLEERTARFGEAVIDLAKSIPQNAVTSRIINQLVGAGTSIGANYLEADDAVSKKEFLKSIGTCKRKHAKQDISSAWQFALSRT